MKQVFCSRCGERFLTVKESLCDKCRREQKPLPSSEKEKKEKKLFEEDSHVR